MNASKYDSELKKLDYTVKHGTVAYRTEQGVRSDTGHIGRVVYHEGTGDLLGLVGTRHELIQPRVIRDIVQELTGRNAWKPESLSVIVKGGGAAYDASCETHVEGEVRTKRGKSEPMKMRMHLRDNLVGRARMTSDSSQWVEICSNGMWGWKAEGASLQLRHTPSIKDRLGEVIGHLGRQTTHFETHLENMQRLADTPLNDAGFKAILDEWFPRDETGERSTRSQNTVDEIERLYHVGEGADPGSMWGAAQAATNWITHRRGTDARREESNLFGSGVSANRSMISSLVTRAEVAAGFGV